MFGRSIQWYVNKILWPLIAVIIVAIVMEVVNIVPATQSIGLMLSVPVFWVTKIITGLYIGKDVAEADHNIWQSVFAGVLLGMFVGFISECISLIHFFFHFGANMAGIFGGFDFYFNIIPEAVTFAFLSFIGGVIAGAKVNNPLK
jgi:hypothetical protein